MPRSSISSYQPDIELLFRSYHTGVGCGHVHKELCLWSECNFSLRSPVPLLEMRPVL